MSVEEYRAQLPAQTGRFGEALKPKSAPKEEPEHELQTKIVADFRRDYPAFANLLFSIPNGGKLPYHKDKKTGRYTSPQRIKLVREGLLSGVPDLCLALPRGVWHGMYVEVKVYPNDLTPEQQHRFYELTAQGYYCVKVLDDQQAASAFHHYVSLPTPQP